MKPIKVSYSIYIKNPKRPSAHYYARVREKGQNLFDVDLHTTSKAQAEAWLKLRRNEVEMVNAKILLGEPVTEDQLKSLVRYCNRYSTTQTVKTISIREAVDNYEQHLRRVGKRETTISTYLRALKAVLSPVYTNPINTITDELIDSQMAQFDGLKASTRKNYSVALHELLKYLVHKYDLSSKLIEYVPKIKVETVERPYWQPFQVQRIIDAVQCRDKVMEQAAKAYFWFLFGTGARQGEAYMVEWSDLTQIDPVTIFVTIRAENTKTNHTRRVPLDWRIARLLYRLPKEGAKVFSALPKSQAGRFSILQRAIKKSGMPAGNMHSFRHSYCMLAYSKTDDIKAISEMVGHSPEVGLKYYQASRQQDRLRETMDKTFEGENVLPSPIDDLVDAGLW